MKKVLLAVGAAFVAFLLYLMFWPVPIDPVVWEPPADEGFSGRFKANHRLKTIEFVSVLGDHGPEDVAIDARGRIYTGTEEGNIIRLKPDATDPEKWVNTGGRALGLDFDASGNLIVADAYLGLLSISPDGRIETLTNECDGIPIRFADDLDIGTDGKIYFSDASVKFSAREWGGAGATSILEIVEQGLTGRLLVYDPSTKTTRELLDGLSFANGVVVGRDAEYVLINETGRYRITRLWLKGPRAGTTDVFVDNLPGFPDNIERGPDGLIWLSLASPRSAELDGVGDNPFMRKVIYRLPKIIQPGPVAYLAVFAFDEQGRVRENLQDPDTEFHANTSVYVTRDALYLGSLDEPRLAIYRRRY